MYNILFHKWSCGRHHTEVDTQTSRKVTCSYFHSKHQHLGCDCKWSPRYWNTGWSIHSSWSSRGTEHELDHCLPKSCIWDPSSVCQHSPSAGRLQYHHYCSMHGCKWYPNCQSAKFQPDRWHIQRMRWTCFPDEELPRAGWLSVQ